MIAFPFLLSFLFLLSCTRQTSLSTLLLLGLLTLPYFVDYFIPSHSNSPFCCFLPYSIISYGWQPLFRHIPYCTLPISTFSRLHLFQVDTSLGLLSPTRRGGAVLGAPRDMAIYGNSLEVPWMWHTTNRRRQICYHPNQQLQICAKHHREGGLRVSHRSHSYCTW